MTSDYSLHDKIFFSGTADEDGEFLVRAYSSTIYADREELRQLRDHLDRVLSAPPKSVEVRILKTMYKNLIGKTGRILHTTPSGNVEVLVNGNEMIILPMDWVERV